MDLARFQELFIQYVRRLFLMGYLERDQFRQFYVAAINNHPGSSLERFSSVLRSMQSLWASMDRIANATMPNFQQLSTFSDGFHVLACRGKVVLLPRVGACRVRDLIRLMRLYAWASHREGCVIYLKMLLSELTVLSTCFEAICYIERAIIAQGGLVPMDW